MFFRYFINIINKNLNYIYLKKNKKILGLYSFKKNKNILFTKKNNLKTFYIL